MGGPNVATATTQYNTTNRPKKNRATLPLLVVWAKRQALQALTTAAMPSLDIEGAPPKPGAQVPHRRSAEALRRGMTFAHGMRIAFKARKRRGRRQGRAKGGAAHGDGRVTLSQKPLNVATQGGRPRGLLQGPPAAGEGWGGGWG